METAKKLDMSANNILDNNSSSPTKEKLDTEKLDKEQIKKVFNLFDHNGDGKLSLAEIDKVVVELYPHIANDKSFLKAAYIDTIKAHHKDIAESENVKCFGYFIQLGEFEYFINRLRDHCVEAVTPIGKLDKNKVKKTFDDLDFDENGNLSQDEAIKAVIELYPHLTDDKPAIKQSFDNISLSGFIDFTDFKHLLDSLHYHNRKTFIPTKKLDEIQLKKIFKVFDYNNDDTLSFDEVRNAIGKLYPHFIKDMTIPVLAFEAADDSKDKLIDFKEFERLIGLLHHYNELFRLFKILDIDDNGYIDFIEFKQGHELLGIDVKLYSELEEKFNEICSEKKGYMLFHEFCNYATKSKLLPENTMDIQEEVRETLDTTKETRVPQETRKNKSQKITKKMTSKIKKLKTLTTSTIRNKIENPGKHKTPTSKNPDKNKIPTGENSDKHKTPTSKNPDKSKIPTGKNSKIPTGKNSDKHKTPAGQIKKFIKKSLNTNR